MLLYVRRVLGICLGLGIFFLFFLVFRLPAQAADFNVTTSPLPVILTVKPGQTISTILRVQNSGTEATQLKVDLKKFKADGDSGRPTLLDRQPGDDYFDWVSFSKTTFDAEPQAWNDVVMTIKTPPTAAFGYYYAVVFSNAGPAPQASKTGSAVSGGSAVLVLVDAQAAGEKKELKVTSFTSDKKLYEYLPAYFKVTVHNSGNIFLAPSGNVFITRGSKTVATLDLNPGGGNILPGTDRTFNVVWKDGFPVFELKYDHGQIVSDKNSNPVQQLNWDFSKVNRLRFGHYNAHLLLTYDNGTSDVPVEADVSFWVVPWKITSIIVLVLVLIGIGIWTSGRGLVRRVRKKKPESKK